MLHNHDSFSRLFSDFTSYDTTPLLVDDTRRRLRSAHPFSHPFTIESAEFYVDAAVKSLFSERNPCHDHRRIQHFSSTHVNIYHLITKPKQARRKSFSQVCAEPDCTNIAVAHASSSNIRLRSVSFNHFRWRIPQSGWQLEFHCCHHEFPFFHDPSRRPSTPDTPNRIATLALHAKNSTKSRFAMLC